MSEKIIYKDFEISPSMYSLHRSTDWCGTHKDYDPTPVHADDPPSDDRIFYGENPEEVERQIDEWWEDLEVATGCNQKV
jgi:hypothetical protein